MAIEVKPFPMKEALAFWRSKTGITKAEFDKLDSAARTRAFAVSGLSRQDQINQVMTALQATLENGGTLAQFTKELGPLLEARGWTGKNAWRVKNIFNTNVQSAYMTGRYRQMTKVAATRPYWRYVAVRDSRTRPSHAALHGLVFRHDHEFWDRYYPPNGFSCRCSVQTLSQRQVDKRGEDVRTELPDRIMLTDPATGAETWVTPMPDKGWGTNVGKDWLAGLEPGELERDLKTLATQAFCRSGQFADDPCKPPLSGLDARHIHTYKESDLLAKSLSKEDQVKAFLGEFGVEGLEGAVVHTVQGGFPLVVNKWLFMDKASGGFKTTWSDKGPYMRLLARTIQNPFEVWWQPVEIGKNKHTYSLRLLRLFRREGAKEIGGYCSFSLLGGRLWHGATAFMPKAGRSQRAIYDYLEAQRGGVLIFREE